MNLSGQWTGKYTYGEGYPPGYRGKSEPFELHITDNDGIFTGTCTDNVVRAIPGNESTIEGVFQDGFMSFIKKYKIRSMLTERGIEAIDLDNVKAGHLHYTGHLTKRLWSRRLQVSGEWTITSEYRDPETGQRSAWTVGGTWSMRAAQST